MIEVLKQALEALEVEQTVYLRTKLPAPEYLTKAIASLRPAIAELESQEPVAWWNDTGTHIDLNVSGRGKPLYTHPPQRTEQNFCPRCGKRTPDLTHIHTCTPPQRTWVGLTKDEQSFVYDQVKQVVDSKPFWVRFADAIEAKLKERNT